MKPLLWLIVSLAAVVCLSDATQTYAEKNKAYLQELLEAVTEVLEYLETAVEEIVSVFVEVELGDVKLYYYNQTNVNDSIVSFPLNDTSCVDSVFDPSKETFFIVHGWQSSYFAEINVLIKEAILRENDVNVFVVGWDSDVSYVYAFDAVPYVGAYLGEFMNNLSQTYNYSHSNIKMAGHSLGAHICGVAGNATGGLVHYILGIDPAGPLYAEDNDTSIRLSADDAETVEAIHTNTNLFGIKFSIGHSDFYPNGGATQPACTTLDDFNGCSHAMSYKYVAESIASGGFDGIKCRMDTTSNDTDYCCNPLELARMGQFSIDTKAHGDYFLTTNSESPYAKGRKFI